jgi:Predicted esterase
MKLNYLILYTLALFVVSHVEAAQVDSVKIYSSSMKKNISAMVVTPDNYSKSNPLPVVYMLHGYGGNYRNSWLNKEPDIDQLADLYNMILVAPDGGSGSWYFDSPIDSSFKYETHIINELIPYIDSNYTTVSNRNGRAITGLSMGGHGAFYLAFRHQDIFGAAGSTSGGVDIRPFPMNWDISKRLGSYAKQPENWEKNTVINMVHLLTPGSLALIFDCGTSDFFYNVNKQLHKKLADRNIPHEFIARPGNHNWDYWKNSIQYHLLYFNHFFTNNR